MGTKKPLLKEVKESRKEKGRDTFGCPIFLRPLPAQLLAKFRQESETESSGSPLQPPGAPGVPLQPMLKGQTESHQEGLQGYLVQGVGTPIGGTPWRIGSESPSMPDSRPALATWNQLHNLQQHPGPVGTSFWI